MRDDTSGPETSSLSGTNTEKPGTRQTGIASAGIDRAGTDRRQGADNAALAFDRDTLARAERLMLKSRRVVEGMRSGLHRSPFHGASVEFAEHKEYTPGDPLRHIDWKLFGKSDKYYVKRYEEETNLQAWILLDTSQSMGYSRTHSTPQSWWQRLTRRGAAALKSGDRDLDAEGSKLEYAGLLAAALSWVLINQGDAVGLSLFNAGGTQTLPPRTRTSHLFHLMGMLASARPVGEGHIGAAMTDFAHRLNRRSMVVLISDLLEDPEQILASLKGLRTRRNDVLILQVMHEDELEFPYDEVSLFEDPEVPAQQLIADPREVREGYLKAMNTWLEEMRKGCFEAQVEHRLISTRTPVATALAELAAGRLTGKGKAAGSGNGATQAEEGESAP